MTNQVRFDSHAAFHQQVLRMTVAGATLGLLGHLWTRLFGPVAVGSALHVAQMTLVAVVLGLATLPPARGARLRAGLAALAIASIGALCFKALCSSPPVYPLFGLGIYGAALGVIVSRDLRDLRRLLVPVATALTVPLAFGVKAVFVGRLALTDFIPAFFAEPLHGAVFGFLVSTALILRQVRLERDRVVQAYEQIAPALGGEMLDLCGRGMATYRRIVDAMRDRQQRGAGAEPKLQRGVQDLMLKIVALGRRWQQVERDAARTSAEGLADRIEELKAKIEGAADPVARRQYEAARDALTDQLGYLRDISRNRERVVARVHAYLAALERVHLAVINHQGADAAKFSDELQPVLDEIDDIGTEMDIASEAISEAAEAALPQGAEDETQSDGEEPTAEAALVQGAEDETQPDGEQPTADPDPGSGEEAPGDEDPELALQRSAFQG